MAGLLTLSDILEALVGDLAWAPGGAASGPAQREDGSWLLDGLTALDDVVDLLQLGPAAADADEDIQTLGGMALARLGRVPATASPGEAGRSRWST